VLEDELGTVARSAIYFEAERKNVKGTPVLGDQSLVMSNLAANGSVFEARVLAVTGRVTITSLHKMSGRRRW
jgi:hypothetical protein